MYDTFKRWFDVLVSATGLVACAPLLALVGLAVRASMGPPAIFRQVRSGLRGKTFTIYKFRSMRAPAPGRAAPEPDGERITPLGAFLRRSRLDELPELWNVLRGDMSLVGPRPTLPEQVERYTPRQRRRLDVRPGLTGWAQVNGNTRLSWPERIELDLWYLERRSFGLDLRILARTVGVVLFGERRVDGALP